MCTQTQTSKNLSSAATRGSGLFGGLVQCKNVDLMAAGGEADRDSPQKLLRCERGPTSCKAILFYSIQVKAKKKCVNAPAYYRRDRVLRLLQQIVKKKKPR
jgi:hypothetical protein